MYAFLSLAHLCRNHPLHWLIISHHLFTLYGIAECLYPSRTIGTCLPFNVVFAFFSFLIFFFVFRFVFGTFSLNLDRGCKAADDF